MRRMGEEFQDALLRELWLATEPTLWRKRKVVQITPLNRYSYRARTSYQLSVPGETIARARQVITRGREGERIVAGILRGVESFLRPTHESDEEWEGILPITQFRKRVLLDFSITDMQNRPIILLNRHEGSLLTLKIIGWQLAKSVGTAGQALFEGNKRLIRAFVFLSLQDIGKRLAMFHVVDKMDQQLDQLLSNMEEFLAYTMRGFMPPELSGRHRCNLREILHGSEELHTRTLSTERPLGLHSPICNPLITSLDYFELKSDEAGGGKGGRDRRDLYAGWLSELIAECRTFQDSLRRLDDLALVRTLAIIGQFVEDYIAYAVVKIKADVPFLIKIEQVVPTEPTSSWPERVLRRQQGYQSYPIVLDDTRSTHVEITSAVPTELEQVPKKTRIRVGGHPVGTDAVFRYSASTTKFLQHFYTTRSDKEETRVVSSEGNERATMAQAPSVVLEIKYRVERVLFVTYCAAGIASILFTVYFFSVLRIPVSGQAGVAMLPLILGAWALLSRIRPQETIVAERLRMWTWISIGCTIITTSWLVMVSVWPDTPAKSFEWLKQGLEWLVRVACVLFVGARELTLAL